jgi:hypothetical protein
MWKKKKHCKQKKILYLNSPTAQISNQAATRTLSSFFLFLPAAAAVQVKIILRVFVSRVQFKYKI